MTPGPGADCFRGWVEKDEGLEFTTQKEPSHCPNRSPGQHVIIITLLDKGHLPAHLCSNCRD